MPWDVSDAEAKDRRLVTAVIVATPAMAEAETIIEAAIDSNFVNESDGTTSWKPLAERTQEQRRALGYGADHPILQRTETLRRSMKGSHDTESAEVGPSEDIEYAAVQNEGSEDGRIPARPYLALAERDEDRIEEAILDHLAQHEG